MNELTTEIIDITQKKYWLNTGKVVDILKFNDSNRVAYQSFNSPVGNDARRPLKISRMCDRLHLSKHTHETN